MRRIDELLIEYGQSHQNRVNKLVHWICVPAIVWSVVALVWSIPFPGDAHLAWLPINWAVILVALALVYWFRLSVPLGLGLLLVFGLLLGFTQQLEQNVQWPLWQVALAVFIVAWIGQFIGHAVEGKRPSFFKDLQFLLIGPAWLLAHAYRSVGLRY